MMLGVMLERLEGRARAKEKEAFNVIAAWVSDILLPAALLKD